MLKIVLLVVVVLVAGVLVAAAMRPNEFSLQRSVSIRAPADKIYPLSDPASGRPGRRGNSSTRP